MEIVYDIWRQLKNMFNKLEVKQWWNRYCCECQNNEFDYNLANTLLSTSQSIDFIEIWCKMFVLATKYHYNFALAWHFIMKQSKQNAKPHHISEMREINREFMIHWRCKLRWMESYANLNCVATDNSETINAKATQLSLYRVECYQMTVVTKGGVRTIVWWIQNTSQWGIRMRCSISNRETLWQRNTHILNLIS